MDSLPGRGRRRAARLSDDASRRNKRCISAAAQSVHDHGYCSMGRGGRRRGRCPVPVRPVEGCAGVPLHAVEQGEPGDSAQSEPGGVPGGSVFLKQSLTCQFRASPGNRASVPEPHLPGRCAPLRRARSDTLPPAAYRSVRRRRPSPALPCSLKPPRLTAPVPSPRPAVPAAGTARLTNPHSAASRAPTWRAVSSISIARFRPIARVNATIGVEQNSPIFTPGVANHASSAATARSHAATNWHPAAVAAPCTQAITGCGIACTVSISSVQTANTCSACAEEQPTISCRSWPALNTGPSAARITTRPVHPRSASIRARIIASDKTLRRGPAMVTVSTVPSAATRIISCLPTATT